MTTSTDPATGTSSQSPVDVMPLVTIDSLGIAAEPAGASTSFQFIAHGLDFSVVMEGMTIELEPGSGPLQSRLRCQLRASVQPPAGHRISRVNGAVTGGGPIEPLDPGRATAVVKTRTTLGGVALPETVQSPAPGAQETQDIPQTEVPALDQCSGQPLALDVLIEVAVNRAAADQAVLAQVDSFDLHFELAPCP